MGDKLSDKLMSDKLMSDKLMSDKLMSDKLMSDKLMSDKLMSDKLSDKLSDNWCVDQLDDQLTDPYVDQLKDQTVNQTTTQLVIFNQGHQSVYQSSHSSTQQTIGKHLYQKNNALRNFANVMEHPEFSTFINEYLFKDPSAVIKLMKLYTHIGLTIKDPYEKLAAFNAQMKDYMRKHTLLNSTSEI